MRGWGCEGWHSPIPLQPSVGCMALEIEPPLAPHAPLALNPRCCLLPACCRAVVEQMARHMRSRGLQQSLGTASALLTAQALQQGREAAKWLLQPPGSGKPSSGGGASGAEVRLPDEAVESCLLGRGSPQACMERLMHAAGGGGGGNSKPAPALRPSTAVANVVLAGLAVRGCTGDAFRLFDWMKQQQAEAQQRAAAAVRAAGSRPRAAPAACDPDQWTLRLLLYAAMNAPQEQQLELTLRAVQEAR